MIPTNPRQAVDRVTRALGAAGDTPWLVGYDANGIQELISSSGRLISMRGASEAILAFDAAVLREQELAIFAGGGRGIVLARSESEARTAAGAFVDSFRQITHGGVMAACAVPFQRGGDAEAQSIRWLRYRLDIEKDAARPPAGVLPDSKERECAYCRNYRGTRVRVREEQRELVCPRCDAMLERGRHVGQEQGHPRGEMSQSIADIAEHDRIAVISADGNNLGALFETLSSLVALAAVSETVSVIFKRAHERALACVDEDKRVPLMTGGDDVRAYIPPSAVIAYVEALAHVVESEASDHTQVIRDLLSADTAQHLANLGVGIGAVVANVYCPTWRLAHYARALEHSAKAACYARKEWRSGFDFAVVTTEDSMSAEPDRTPPTRDIRPLRPCTEEWRAALRNARALAKIPSTQLGILAAERGPSEDPSEKDELRNAELGNALRYQVARSEKWREWYTTCGIDWRDPVAVLKRRPDPGSLQLARLLALQETRA